MEKTVSPHPRGYVCYRAESQLSLNGKLDDPAWKAVPWTEAFVDIEGDKQPKPRFLTRAKMLWDDAFFYIGVDMEEPHVWATLTERDSVIFQDNDFEVFIDPDGDNHQYYEIEINALNTVWDLRLTKPYRDKGKALNEWDVIGMKSAVHVDGTLNDPSTQDRGWSVEMAFPWKALGEYANCPCPPRDGDQWRVNFSRVEWDIEIIEGKYRKIEKRPEHNWVWSPQDAIDMHRPERWGYIQFSTAAPGSVTFRPDPTHTFRDYLHRLYYAQRAFHEKHNRYAATLPELDENEKLPRRALAVLGLRLVDDGYIASVQYRPRDKGTWKRLSIQQDSRIWIEDTEF
jgi:hypothetical protein